MKAPAGDALIIRVNFDAGTNNHPHLYRLCGTGPIIDA
jgi:hypothetical protein